MPTRQAKGYPAGCAFQAKGIPVIHHEIIIIDSWEMRDILMTVVTYLVD